MGFARYTTRVPAIPAVPVYLTPCRAETSFSIAPASDKRCFRRHAVKRLLFGYPNTTSYWKLAIEGASRREQIVDISGELHAEFFVARTPMCISPIELEEFATGLEKLDSTLQGSVRLASANETSEIDWLLTVLPLGHIDLRAGSRSTRTSCGSTFARTKHNYGRSGSGSGPRCWFTRRTANDA